MPTDNNTLPQLLDLRLRINAHEAAAEKDVIVDLRIYRTEIDCPDGGMLSVELKRATLELELVGLETAPRSRYGEPLKEPQVVEKQATKITTTAAGKVAGAASLDISKLVPANLRLTTDASIEAKAIVTSTSTVELKEFRVKARGGDTWEVVEPATMANGKINEHPILDGTYLEDAPLCKVKPQLGANMQAVSLSALVKQRDLTLKIADGTLKQKFQNLNQERLFSILVSKSLGLIGPKYAGVIKISKSELEIED